jgi:hypothetical protein
MRSDLLSGSKDKPARIAAYTGRGTLRAWLRVIVVRDIINQEARETKEQLVEDDQFASHRPTCHV